jgi:hypothetical protein
MTPTHLPDTDSKDSECRTAPQKKAWMAPQLSVLPIAANTHHAANTVSDGTGNLLS